jgi:hypothetical protein
MRTLLFMCIFAFAGPLAAAEDYRVMKLEQDMRNLEREVQSLQRLVTDLQQRAFRVDPSFTPSPDRTMPAPEGEQLWLKASAWNRVRSGMSELEVIEILGKPTALRPDASNRRALLYTLELGQTSFLTGSVSFVDGKAVEIQKPMLR